MTLSKSQTKKTVRDDESTVLTDSLDYDFTRNAWCVLGLPIDSCDLAEAEAVVREAVRHGRQMVLSTPNVNWVVAARCDPEFRHTAIDSDLCAADGMPIVWAAKLLGLPFTERVGGSNLTENLLNRDAKHRLSIFFFGGEKGVAERAAERINARRGGLEAVGWLYPGQGSVDSMSHDDTIETINASKPDILLVALGARKGQAWIQRNRHQLNARAISHLGATINFLAGSVSRAPIWMQRSGLEWIWRIIEEPKLAGRYARDGVVLIWLFATRLLPYSVLLKRRAFVPDSREALVIELDTTESYCLLSLRGEATRRSVESELPVLYRAVCAENDLILDLSGVDYVDSGFIALLMLVGKHVCQRGGVLRIEGVSTRVRRLFRYNCAEFLLETERG